jgi:hypothetical protein
MDMLHENLPVMVAGIIAKACARDKRDFASQAKWRINRRGRASGPLIRLPAPSPRWGEGGNLCCRIST